jgi:2-haloacid dehalogenase
MTKPDPRIYHLILEELAVQPAEALFVDDYPRNVEAALALGMKAIRFTGTSALREDLQQHLKWDAGTESP